MLLAGMEAELQMGKVRLCTISAYDEPLTLYEWREKLHVDWPFLSDTERQVQKDLDIKEYTDTRRDVMLPHTLILEPGLKIYKVYNGYWFFGRPAPADIWHDCRELTRRLRSDWDPTAPGLREQWEAGETGRFWPYQGSGEPS